ERQRRLVDAGLGSLRQNKNDSRRLAGSKRKRQHAACTRAEIGFAVGRGELDLGEQWPGGRKRPHRFSAVGHIDVELVWRFGVERRAASGSAGKRHLELCSIVMSF